VHVTLVPWIAAAGELKTKPTQHSVKELRAIGIQPDILICRCEKPLVGDIKEKIALFCDVGRGRHQACDAKSVYEVPLGFAEQGVDEIILQQFKIEAAPRDLSRWSEMLDRMNNPVDEVDIGLVGKYVEYEDSYKSLKEALLHGGFPHRLKVNLHWVEARICTGRTARSGCRSTTASWCRAASASAAWKGCCRRSATRGSGRCRISASVWACRRW
jgi:CTP synthase